MIATQLVRSKHYECSKFFFARALQQVIYLVVLVGMVALAVPEGSPAEGGMHPEDWGDIHPAAEAGTQEAGMGKRLHLAWDRRSFHLLAVECRGLQKRL